MEEVGFVRVKVHIIPRNIVDDTSSSSSELDSDSDSDSESEGAQDSTRRQKHQQGQAHDKQSIGASGDADADADHIDFAHLLRRTEREERAKALYRPLVPGEKVFTERSFGSESMFDRQRKSGRVELGCSVCGRVLMRRIFLHPCEQLISSPPCHEEHRFWQAQKVRQQISREARLCHARTISLGSMLGRLSARLRSFSAALGSGSWVTIVDVCSAGV